MVSWNKQTWTQLFLYFDHTVFQFFSRDICLYFSGIMIVFCNDAKIFILLISFIPKYFYTDIECFI